MRIRTVLVVEALAAAVMLICAPGAAVAEAEVLVPSKQRGEDRWVGSLALTSGALIQNRDGYVSSVLFEDGTAPPVTLREPVSGSDTAVTVFAGASWEIMGPALDLPRRPRFFLSGDILPTFASDRSVALQGDLDCIRGPEPDAPCARDEIPGTRTDPFPEQSANGQGSETVARTGKLAFGASLGLSFPFDVGERQVRVKPSIGWLAYRVKARGMIVDAACDPVVQCTDIVIFGFPSPGFLRETILRGSATQWFHAIGPGVDVEVDVANYDPVGVSLFMGARAYRTLGDRTIRFVGGRDFDDQIGMDRALANFEVKNDAWIYRAHVGIRLQWVGWNE